MIKADSINKGVYSIDSKPFGVTYQEWVGRWWQWHISIPPAEHPRENFTPERCALMQNGPVWKLADGPNGQPVERDCTIPFGKAIMVQIQGGYCGYAEPQNRNDADIEECVDSGNRGAVVSASIDGVPVKNLQNYRSGHYWFNMTIPQDNIYNERAGTWKSLVDGWYLFLEPLPLGKHDIHIKGDVSRLGSDQLPTEEDHHIDVLYHLTIAKT